LNSVISELANLKKIPDKGLAIFSGLSNDDGDENIKLSKTIISFEPKNQITKYLYYCDNKFHVDSLLESINSQEITNAFIIVSGEGTSMFNVTSNGIKTLIKKIKDPNLPNKHRKGGQSQKRFLHLQEESRSAYVKIISEEITKTFIKNNSVTCKSIILAGPANLKNVVFEKMEIKLKSIVVGIYDIQYNGFTGLEEAIDASKENILNDIYLKEIKLMKDFYTLILKDSKKVIYILNDVLNHLNINSIETIYISTIFNVECFFNKNDKKIFLKNYDNNYEKINLIDYFMFENNDIKNLELISSNTSEGNEFLKGFGGIGAILRYEVDFSVFDNEKYFCNEDKYNQSDDEDLVEFL